MLTSKLEAYVKALESKELKQEDVDALFSTLDRLNASRDKKEKNVWNNPASQYWMKIADYLPEPALLKEWLDKHP